MQVKDKNYKTIWLEDKLVKIIDQRYLPHKFVIEEIKTPLEMAFAIKEMHLRGAGLIGAAAGYGVYLSGLVHFKDNLDINKYKDLIKKDVGIIKNTRPTAVNLEYALNRQLELIDEVNNSRKLLDKLKEEAVRIAEEDETSCESIGRNGVEVIRKISESKNRRVVNVLTHCNAGWLAFVDYGTATSPIYQAQKEGIDVHVWVDETRPRNQGARLTAWELGQQGIKHTIIADNVGGYLMQKGLVDLVIVGSDRTTYTGDVANKIGTYLKALAAYDNKVPFYVALPSSTFDWKIKDGAKDIPIEEREGEEVKYIQGLSDGEIKKVLLTPEDSEAKNFGFDVTPAKYITGLITEKGICRANESSIKKLIGKNK